MLLAPLPHTAQTEPLAIVSESGADSPPDAVAKMLSPMTFGTAATWCPCEDLPASLSLSAEPSPALPLPEDECP